MRNQGWYEILASSSQSKVNMCSIDILVTDSVTQHQGTTLVLIETRAKVKISCMSVTQMCPGYEGLD